MDNLRPLITEHQATNLALRRRLMNAEAGLRRLIAKYPYWQRYTVVSPEARRINAAIKLVDSLRAKLETHSNLLAELDGHNQQGVCDVR